MDKAKKFYKEIKKMIKDFTIGGYVEIEAEALYNEVDAIAKKIGIQTKDGE